LILLRYHLNSYQELCDLNPEAYSNRIENLKSDIIDLKTVNKIKNKTYKVNANNSKGFEDVNCLIDRQFAKL